MSGAPTESPAAGPGNNRKAIAALLAVAGFSLLVLPGRFPTPTLEPSWQAVLNFAALHHLQHGVDLVFTYGPLGYLMHNCFDPGTWWRVVLFQLVSRAVYVALVWRVLTWQPAGGERIPLGARSRFAPPNRPGLPPLSPSPPQEERAGERRPMQINLRPVVFGAAALTLPALDLDSFYLLFITFTAVVLCRDSTRDWLAWTALLLLSLMPLLKATYLVFSVIALGCVVLGDLAGRRWLRAAGLPLLFAFSFLFGWRVLGQQQFQHLPLWLRGAAETATAYQLSMGVVAETNNLLCGLLALGLITTAIAAAVVRARKLLPLGALLFCGTLLAWKQAYTRGDIYHARNFFICAFVLFAGVTSQHLTFATPGRRTPGAAPGKCQMLRCDPLLILMFGLALGGGLLARLPVPVYRLFENVGFVLRLPRLHASYLAYARGFDLPRIRSLVGSGTVDVAGAEQAIAILNRFNYRPAPAFQPYFAATPWLAGLNADFYRSDRAPDFVITHDYTIDDRLPNLDASLSGWVLAQSYQQVAVENGYRLLRRVAECRSSPAAVDAGTVKTGERFPVTGGSWCEVVFEENWLGRLSARFWMLPPVAVELSRADGSSAIYRFVPSLAKLGFVVPHNAASLTLLDTPAARLCFQPAICYRTCPIPPPIGRP